MYGIDFDLGLMVCKGSSTSIDALQCQPSPASPTTTLAVIGSLHLMQNGPVYYDMHEENAELEYNELLILFPSTCLKTGYDWFGE